MVPRLNPILADDRDAAQLLASDLSQTRSAHKPSGAIGSLIVSFFTLGAFPGLLWHERFSNFVNDEKLYLRRFADWLRLRSSRPETMDLRVAGEDLGVRSLLSGLSILSVVGVTWFFAVQLHSDGPFGLNPVETVIHYTYKFHSREPWNAPLSEGQKLNGIWNVGLSIAYLFHWLQVQSHASDARRFARQANKIFRAEGVPRVPLPYAGLRLTTLWVFVAVLLAWKGAWWGIPMALSGGAQQHYMGSESMRFRRALAARVREIAQLPQGTEDRRDGASAHLSSTGRDATRRCPHVRCLAPMPPGARFCPRCGHNVPENPTMTI